MSKSKNKDLEAIENEEGLFGVGPKALKNFRSSTDIENFFRFVYENELRKEAFEILSQAAQQKVVRRKK